MFRTLGDDPAIIVEVEELARLAPQLQCVVPSQPAEFAQAQLPAVYRDGHLLDHPVSKIATRLHPDVTVGEPVEVGGVELQRLGRIVVAPR